MKHANRWLGWLAAAVLGFGGVLPEARAETETVDGIPWTYTVSGGVASLGKLPFYWGGYDEATFLGTPVIAAMLENLSLQNGGVFMEEGAGWVKVQ